MIVQVSYLINGNTFLAFNLMVHCMQETVNTSASHSIAVKRQYSTGYRTLPIRCPAVLTLSLLRSNSLLFLKELCHFFFGGFFFV